jgi:glycosyltransferase involved in cell wall biosynthesis
VLVLKSRDSNCISVHKNIRVLKVNQKRYRGNSNFRYIVAYIFFFLRILLRITTLSLKMRYRIIHVNNMPDFIVFAAILPKLKGAALILDIHDPMPNTFLTKFKSGKNGFMYKILLQEEKVSAKFADHVITVNDPVKDEILIEEGIPGDKISVVRNFADSKVFKLIDHFHLNTKIGIVFYGTIAERFGFRTILKVISELNMYDNLYFKIIGSGDFSPQLKQLISDYHLESVVEFDNNTYPVKEIPGIVGRFHLGIVSYDLSPATEYMLPVKMLEMFLLGIPVITIRNRAIGHYFNENLYFKYDPEEPDTLKELLEQVLRNPGIIVEKRNAILNLRSEFLWENESRIYQKILNNLMEKQEYEKN